MRSSHLWLAVSGCVMVLESGLLAAVPAMAQQPHTQLLLPVQVDALTDADDPAIAQNIFIPRRRRDSNRTPANNQSRSGIAQEMVDAHNRWRSRVGAPPLRWSSQLASYAQEWADRLAPTGQLTHRSQRQYGENLFWGSGRRWSPTEVVDSWGNEVNDYNYANNSCRGVCGHYTQVVWAKTTEVGCAVARSGNEEVWVCNYNPPGNYIGQRPY